jgi:hypothetical protein
MAIFSRFGGELSVTGEFSGPLIVIQTQGIFNKGKEKKMIPEMLLSPPP